MPSTVTLYSVKIACPGDAAMELIVAHTVIAQWNARHALAEKRILLPLGEDLAGDAEHDLLLEFFCGATIPTEAEVRRRRGGNRKPVAPRPPPRSSIFPTPAPISAAPDPLQSAALEEFQKRHMTATVDSYGNEKEFRAKFARQLEAIVTHARTLPGPLRVDRRTRRAQAARPAPHRPAAPGRRPSSSRPATTSRPTSAASRSAATLRIQANGKQLVEQTDAESLAKWESAFNELLEGAYIRDAGCKRPALSDFHQGLRIPQDPRQNPGWLTSPNWVGCRVAVARLGAAAIAPETRSSAVARDLRAQDEHAFVSRAKPAKICAFARGSGVSHF